MLWQKKNRVLLPATNPPWGRNLYKTNGFARFSNNRKCFFPAIEQTLCFQRVLGPVFFCHSMHKPLPSLAPGMLYGRAFLINFIALFSYFPAGAGAGPGPGAGAGARAAAGAGTRITRRLVFHFGWKNSSPDCGTFVIYKKYKPPFLHPGFSGNFFRKYAFDTVHRVFSPREKRARETHVTKTRAFFARVFMIETREKTHGFP